MQEPKSLHHLKADNVPFIFVYDLFVIIIKK